MLQSVRLLFAQPIGMALLAAVLWLSTTNACAATPTYVVTNLEDTGSGSLRDAVARLNASSGGTVVFADDLPSNIIHLYSGELVIETEIVIRAAHNRPMTIDAHYQSRIFTIQPHGRLTLHAMIMKHGLDKFGGSIYNQGQLILHHVSVTHSQAYARGGGIYNDTHAQLQLNGTLIAYNEAGIHGTGGPGGGIYLGTGGQLLIDRSTIAHNIAHEGGGGGFGGGIYHDDDSNSTITNTTLNHNAAEYGGGLFNRGSLTLSNTTVAGNKAIDGGGIYDGSLSANNQWLFYNNTIANNYARPDVDFDGQGGGIYLNHVLLTLENTIVANNIAEAGWEGIAHDIYRYPFGSAQITTPAPNLIGDTTTVAEDFLPPNITDQSPQLLPLNHYPKANGYYCHTQTMPLAPRSPAVNAGLRTDHTPKNDQCGYLRGSVLDHVISLGASEAM